tara:strand:- start:3401 stop:4474 length:1074 start_codon:yes stop_codon:yes gene_type:complete
MKNIFKNKIVIITGHTGFKGTWLTFWMHHLGAKVVGISKDIPTNPSLFKILKLNKKIVDIKLDIRNLKKLQNVFKKFQPNFVFHLAAQSLVKKSYQNPIETFTSNTVGTLNVMESIKQVKKNCNSVIITSDKSYKNLEIKRGYHEEDLLGGKDPYSASKASAELIIQSYIHTFYNSKNNKKLFAVARAGNVIGGGDWSEDRLIPDCIKAWSRKNIVKIRNPNSTRPWQHVLEALRGYLTLQVQMQKNKKIHGEAFNFGPKDNQNKKVIQLVEEIKKNWKNISWLIEKSNKENLESNLLKLNSNKAKKKLGWVPILSFSTTIEMISNWYKNFYNKKNVDIEKFTKDQIIQYGKKIKLK